jgi:hypothetical protein
MGKLAAPQTDEVKMISLIRPFLRLLPTPLCFGDNVVRLRLPRNDKWGLMDSAKL